MDIESGRDEVNNPDDHGFEPLAWFDPKDLEGNSAVREEILDDLDILLPMLKRAGGMGISGLSRCARGSAGKTQNLIDLTTVVV